MSLASLRRLIDQIDLELLEVLEKRAKVVSVVINHKQKHNISIFQPKREREILILKQSQAKKLNLDPLFIKRLFKLIIQQSKNNQRKIIK